MDKKNVKKILLLLLTIGLCISLSACSLFGGGGDTTLSSVDAETLISNAVLQYPKTNDLFRYNVYDTYVEITEYIGTEPNVTVPSTLDELPVLVIASTSFTENETVTSVKISNGITVIAENAFAKCPNLKTVETPSTLYQIGEGCFTECVRLNQITIPAGVETIPSSLCTGCSSLTSVTIEGAKNVADGETNRSIEDGAFSECVNLQNVWIPNDIATIGESAFEGSLEKLTMYGYAASPAAQYSATNLVDFVVLEEDEFAEIVDNTEEVKDPNEIISEKIKEIESHYLNENGFVDENKQDEFKEQINKLGETLKADGTIAGCSLSDTQATFTTELFGSFVYDLPFQK